LEVCDVVDKFGNRTGRIVIRKTKLSPEEFYLVVHVWIKDENNNYLIQQRTLDLDSDPGVWAATVGYVMSGEESIDGVIREAAEELGLQLLPNQLKQIDRHALDNRVEDVWMAEVSRNSIGRLVPGNEVADCKWVSRAELEHLVNQGEIFRYSYHGKLF